MNGEKLFELLGDAGERFIEETRPERNSPPLLGIILPAAACIALALLFALILPKRPKEEERTANENGLKTEDPAGPTGGETLVIESGPSGMIEASWIGFFKHDGAIYAAQEMLPAEADCVGDYIGTSSFAASSAKTNADYAEMTGSFIGRVYAVKGVDPSLLLCTRYENGAVELFVNRDDASPYLTGRGILEDKLRLSSFTDDAVLEAGRSENRAFFRAGKGQAEAVTALIALLDEGEVYQRSFTEPAAETYGILYLRAQNGLVIALRLCDGYAQLVGHSSGSSAVCIRTDGAKLREFVELIKSADVPAEDPHAAPTTLEDCRRDPRLGAFVPAAVPEGYKLVYAVIERRLGGDGSILGTERIEFEIRNADGFYIHADIDPAAEGASVSPTLEDVRSAIVRSPENYTVTAIRPGVRITVSGVFGCPAEDVYAVLSSIGE